MCSEITVKQSGESMHVVNIEVEERKGCSGKDLQRRRVLSLKAWSAIYPALPAVDIINLVTKRLQRLS